MTIAWFREYNLSMTLANFLTSLRIILSPFFFIAFFIPVWGGGCFEAGSVWLCWSLFIVIEFSDLFDGMAARAAHQVSDFGKLFDPFADVFSRLTYFLCFVGIGLMPVWIMALIIYREITIMFLRTMMMRKGIAMGARMGGKLKAWAYAISGIGGMIFVSIQRLGIFQEVLPELRTVTLVLFIIAGLASLISLSDYLIVVKKAISK